MMSSRTLATVALRVAALIGMAGVLAACPITAFYASVPTASDPSSVLLRIARTDWVVHLVVRFAVVLLVYFTAPRLARAIVTDEPGDPPSPGKSGIQLPHLTHLAFALVAILLLAEAVQGIAAPLYWFAVRPRWLARVDSVLPDFWQRQVTAATAWLVVGVAAAVIFRQEQVAERVRATLAAVRRPPLDD